MPTAPRHLLAAALLSAAVALPASAQSSATISQQCAQAGSPSRYPEARARVQAASQQGGAAGAFAQGCLHLADDRYEQAATAFEQAVRADDRNAVYHFYLGQAYGAQAQRAGMLGKASLARKTKGEFDRAVQLDPEYIEARQGLMQFYLLAPGIMGGSQQKAREQAHEIRKRSPYVGALAYASLSLRGKDTTAALRELEAAARQFPDSASPATSLAALHVRRRDHPAAWAAVDRLARVRPTRRPGGTRGAGRRPSRASSSTAAPGRSRAISPPTPAAGAPTLGAAHWRLGMIRERQGRRDDARAEYEAAVRLDPRLKDARAALDRLR
jgi:tetratricopeptide (TPR) repeat protein